MVPFWLAAAAILTLAIIFGLLLFIQHDRCVAALESEELERHRERWLFCQERAALKDALASKEREILCLQMYVERTKQ